MVAVRVLLSFLALAIAPRAQGTLWVVDDDGGPDVDATSIQVAVSLANDGDAILVRDGTYGQVHVYKDLAVFADEGADVTCVGGLLIGAGLMPGEKMGVRGIEFRDTYPIACINGSQGDVWIEDCSTVNLGIQAGSGYFAKVDVLAIRTVFQGAPVTSLDAVYSWKSNLHLSDCTSVADAPSGATDPGGAGATIGNGSTLFASGGTFVGADAEGGGGDGLRVVQSTATTLGGVYTGGLPGGQPVGLASGGTHQALPGTARSFRASAVVREGEPITLDFAGEPGDRVLLGVALDTVTPTFVPSLNGTLAIAPGPLIDLGVLPPSGSLSLSFPAGLPAGLGHQVLLGQPAFVSTGGGVFLGPGSAVLVVDDAP